MATIRSKAKDAKFDEYYTQYEEIQKEVNAYLEFNPDTFRGKTILLPCDDPEWSNFTKFFAQNFESLGLKRLISTSYSSEKKIEKYGDKEEYHQISIFEMNSPNFDEDTTPTHGKIFYLDENMAKGQIDIDALEWKYLEGDGSFQSEEVTKLRDEADIIVTNPPFSLYRKFIEWIFEGQKKFLIIGNIDSVTCKEIFPLVMENKLWIGASCEGKDMVFEVPEGTEINPKDKEKAEKLGYVGNYTRMGNTAWFTNIDHGRRHRALNLMTMADNRKFSKHKEIRDENYGYRKYDNYDAIEVKYNDAIPSDYYGIMGVANSFLLKFCPEQFEILGCTQRGCHDLVPDTRKYNDYKEMRQNGESTGSSGVKTNENAVLEKNDGTHNYYINSEGRIVQSLNTRIFIRRISNGN